MTSAEWAASARDVAARLESMAPSLFFDPATDKYHPIRDEALRLTWALNMPNLASDQHLVWIEQVRSWPWSAEWARNAEIGPVLTKLQHVFADERWVIGAAVKPLETRFLPAALRRLADNIEEFEVKDVPGL